MKVSKLMIYDNLHKCLLVLLKYIVFDLIGTNLGYELELCILHNFNQSMLMIYMYMYMYMYVYCMIIMHNMLYIIVNSILCILYDLKWY